MWGGRFAVKPDALMQAINVSIDFDRRLAAEDLAGSRAHAAMLAKTGVITAADEAAIQRGLGLRSRPSWRTAASRSARKTEDIHMNVEQRLTELIGDAAGRLHTARPPNDQVALDVRLAGTRRCDRTTAAIKGLQRPCWPRPRPCGQPDAPGFTHPQPAQPVTLATTRWPMSRCSAATPPVSRRCAQADERVAAGSSRPWKACRSRIDPHQTAKALGFDRPAANSMDAVASRDFALEAPVGSLGICAINPVASGGRDGHQVDAAVRLHPIVGRLLHRLVDHAAEAKP